MKLIDKSAVVEEIEKRRSRNSKNKLNLAAAFEDNYFLSFLDTLEVKDVNDAYKQGYNDAIDKFCEFMQDCEGYVVSGTKCNYDNFIKYMEEQQWKVN